MGNDVSKGRKIWILFCCPFYLLTWPIMGLALLINNHFYPDFFQGIGLAICFTVLILILDTLWMRLVWGKW